MYLHGGFISSVMTSSFYVIKADPTTLSDPMGYHNYLMTDLKSRISGISLAPMAYHAAGLMFSPLPAKIPHMILFGGSNLLKSRSTDMVAINLLTFVATNISKSSSWAPLPLYAGCAVSTGSLLVTFGGTFGLFPQTVFCF